MLDYKGIEALYTVQELQSFEAAAKKLHITQSAVSQRIKGLETIYGEPVLIRTLPYTLTRLGKYLVGHFKQLCLLEDSLKTQMETVFRKPHISIAINRDSLETWFLKIMENSDNVILEIIADDQELTLEYLKKGLVSACVSSVAKEIQGGKAAFLGTMEYVLAASPKFVEHYFSKGDPKKCLLSAPAIKFDKNDRLHERYLEKFFGLHSAEINFQVIPSVRGFKKCAVLGYGYGLIPKIDIEQELKKKDLVQLYSNKIWKIPLYWHYWALESPFYKKFNADMIRYASDLIC